jgi:hypothetical protein
LVIRGPRRANPLRLVIKALPQPDGLFEVSKLATAPARAEDPRSILLNVDVPDACLSPDHLRTSLAPPNAACRPSRDYQRFYGLDLGTQLAGRLPGGGVRAGRAGWLPEQPVATLFLLHGYYDHMGLYRHVIEWALEQGLP